MLFTPSEPSEFHHTQELCIGATLLTRDDGSYRVEECDRLPKNNETATSLLVVYTYTGVNDLYFRKSVAYCREDDEEIAYVKNDAIINLFAKSIRRDASSGRAYIITDYLPQLPRSQQYVNHQVYPLDRASTLSVMIYLTAIDDISYALNSSGGILVLVKYTQADDGLYHRDDVTLPEEYEWASVDKLVAEVVDYKIGQPVDIIIDKTTQHR